MQIVVVSSDSKLTEYNTPFLQSYRLHIVYIAVSLAHIAWEHRAPRTYALGRVLSCTVFGTVPYSTNCASLLVIHHCRFLTVHTHRSTGFSDVGVVIELYCTLLVMFQVHFLMDSVCGICSPLKVLVLQSFGKQLSRLRVRVEEFSSKNFEG